MYITAIDQTLTTVTIKWNKLPHKKCIHQIEIYKLEIQNGKIYQKQIITSSSDITISDLNPCSEYFINISAIDKYEND